MYVLSLVLYKLPLVEEALTPCSLPCSCEQTESFLKDNLRTMSLLHLLFAANGSGASTETRVAIDSCDV